MDPNANLKEQRELVRKIQNAWDNCNDDGSLTAMQAAVVANWASRLAELVEALDGWISKGGSLPWPWKRQVDAVSPRRGA